MLEPRILHNLYVHIWLDSAQLNYLVNLGIKAYFLLLNKHALETNTSLVTQTKLGSYEPFLLTKMGTF